MALQVGPFVLTVAVVILLLLVADRVLLRRRRLSAEKRLPRQLLMLALTLAGAVAAILSLPVSEGVESALLGLLGIALAAVLTLSSPTVAANFMAGLVLRQVRAFRPGDFVRVGEHFGRVSERDLFHVEIQTEDRDLVTLPNVYLISHPVRVVRSSGTIVSCTVTLGYDVAHAVVTPLLTRAATDAGLDEPFVQVRALHDHAVEYRACGLLGDVATYLSAHTLLRKAVLDELHAAGVEIVSPSFVNHRGLEGRAPVIPEAVAVAESRPSPAPETIVFDKAEDAQRVDRVREALEAARARVKELEARRAEATGGAPEALEAELEHERKLAAYLDSQVARLAASQRDA